MTSNDTRKQDLADAKAWLCARWHQKHPNEQHIIQLADYAAHLRATPKPPAGGDIPAGARERIAAYIAELLGVIQPFAIAAERAGEVNALRDHSDRAHVYPWNYVNLTHFADAFGAYSERLDPDDWAILSTTPKPPAGGDAGAVEQSDAIESVAAERRRQIAKGWTAEHDDLHVDGEIATQAVYVLRGWNVRRPASVGRSSERTWVDPYKHNPRECLVIAAALVVAEIERIDRMTASEQTTIEDWSE